MIKNRNILVAGGSGLVGTNLTLRLKQLGAKVLATHYSRQPQASKENYRRFDFTNFSDCLKATKGMDYVFISAAQTFGAKMTKNKPTEYIFPNLNINAGLLEACSRNRVAKVALISSSTVYQEAFYPIAEDDLDMNKPPYHLYFGVGWLNRYIEQLAKFYQEANGLKVCIVRPSYIYGPYDNFEDEKSHVVPALIKRALNKKTPYVIWGDGYAVRDFIYVDDFVDYLIGVFNKHCLADPVNVSSGLGMTIREAVDIVLDLCGHKVKPIYDKSKPAAIPYRVLDVTKLKSILGEKIRMPFRKGIEKTIKWYQSRVKPDKE